MSLWFTSGPKIVHQIIWPNVATTRMDTARTYTGSGLGGTVLLLHFQHFRVLLYGCQTLGGGGITNGQYFNLYYAIINLNYIGIFSLYHITKMLSSYINLNPSFMVYC